MNKFWLGVITVRGDIIQRTRVVKLKTRKGIGGARSEPCRLQLDFAKGEQ